MSTSKTWPGGATSTAAATYSIPASGELSWSALSSFLIALADTAQATTLQKFAVRKCTTTPVSVSADTDCVVITQLAIAGTVTVNLPAGANKQVFFISDGTGDAGTNTVTINRAGSDTIGGGTSTTLTHNREAIILVFNSGDTDWKIVSRMVPPGTITSTDISGAILPAKGGTGIVNNDAATLTRSGNHGLTLTTTGTTSLTLPTSGTLAATVTSTRGDLIYRNATVDAALAIGTAGKALIAGANDPSWAWPTFNAVASAAYVVLDNDGYRSILVTTGNTNRTITLPLAANNSGRIIHIKKVDSGTGYVIADGNGSETIDGALTLTLRLQYMSMTLQCDGTAWHVIDSKRSSPWVATTFTYSAGFGTTANASMFTRFVEDELFIRGAFQLGTAAGTEAQMIMPTGWAINTSLMNASSRCYLGEWVTAVTGNGLISSTDRRGCLFSDASATDTIFWAVQTSATAFVKSVVTNVTSSSAYLMVNMSVPIS